MVIKKNQHILVKSTSIYQVSLCDVLSNISVVLKIQHDFGKLVKELQTREEMSESLLRLFLLFFCYVAHKQRISAAHWFINIIDSFVAT